MQESKYFYNNIPLAKYCKDNDINIASIRSRIWKKKQNKKYKKYSEQEIVNMVIEEHGSRIKYMYNGITLRQYCIENNIKFGTITSRISSLRKTNENLSNDELVVLAMEEFDNKNYRFFYHGIPLKQYCEDNNLSYKNIITYMSRYKDNSKFKNLTDDEFVENVEAKEISILTALKNNDNIKVMKKIKKRFDF